MESVSMREENGGASCAQRFRDKRLITFKRWTKSRIQLEYFSDSLVKSYHNLPEHTHPHPSHRLSQWEDLLISRAMPLWKCYYVWYCIEVKAYVVVCPGVERPGMNIVCFDGVVPLLLVELTESEMTHTVNTYGDVVDHMGCQQCGHSGRFLVILLPLKWGSRSARSDLAHAASLLLDVLYRPF